MFWTYKDLCMLLKFMEDGSKPSTAWLFQSNEQIRLIIIIINV